MLTRNQTPDIYCNSLNKIQTETGRRIKTEPCSFSYPGSSSYTGNEWTKLSRTDNNYHDQNTNDFKMFPKETRTQNGTEISSTQYDEKISFNGLNCLVPRAEREFVPINRKDSAYWSKRTKNNDSARRSRMKRRTSEQDVVDQLRTLQKENIELKYELASLNRHFATKQMDALELPESLNSECMGRKYENVSPCLDASNGELSTSPWNTRPNPSFGNAVRDVLPIQNILQVNTIARAETSSVKIQSRDHERASNDLSNGVSCTPYGATFSNKGDLTGASVAGYYTDSCETADRHVANTNQQAQMSAPENTTTPIIVDVFSLRNDSANDVHFGNSLDSKQGIQSVPHKYRHKRGFHSAFSRQ